MLANVVFFPAQPSQRISGKRVRSYLNYQTSP